MDTMVVYCFLPLQENKYFEDAFKVFERGVKIFKYPHVKDIWVTYLTKFVKRYQRSKLERARELFTEAVQKVNRNLTLLEFCH
jgi:pre-mRNA-splicing factor SYF1